MILLSIETPIHLLTMQRFMDRLDDLLGPSEHVAVPEPQHAKSCGAQEEIATLIVGCLRGVLSAIQFNDDASIGTRESADVETDLMLSAEFEAAQLTAPQAVPQETFCGSRILAKVTDISTHPRSSPRLDGVNMPRNYLYEQLYGPSAPYDGAPPHLNVEADYFAGAGHFSAAAEAMITAASSSSRKPSACSARAAMRMRLT